MTEGLSTETEHKCPSRKRDIGLYVLTFFIVGLMLITDPDVGIIQNMSIGSGVLATVTLIVRCMLVICMIHWGRKIALPYFDFSDTLAVARKTPEGAGLALIAVSVMCLAFSVGFIAIYNV
jgi:hypothetical protein